MAQGNLIKKSSLKKKNQTRKPAKRSRENKKGAVSRNGKGSKAVRNKYTDIKNTTRIIDAKNLATAAAKATMSGGGRFFLGDVETKAKNEVSKTRRAEQITSSFRELMWINSLEIEARRHAAFLDYERALYF